MSDGVSIAGPTGAVRLKWHKLRRRASDAPFLRANLLGGLALGAAIEVDLVATADGHFVCLHDLTLDRETTGEGPARQARRTDIERLRQRANDGTALSEPPLFLDEIVEELRRAGAVNPGSVQLDVKEPQEGLDEALLERFKTCIGEAAPAFTIGGTEWATVERLSKGLEGVHVGFDPLAAHEAAPPRTARGFQAVLDLTLDAAPEASIVYLYWRLVLAALDVGVDLIGACHATRKEVDVWTLDPAEPKALEAIERVVAAGADQITTNDALALERLWAGRHG